VDFKELARLSAEKQMAPFKYLASELGESLSDVSSRLDKLTELAAGSSEFLVETNKIQTKLANDLKASSKKNIWFSIGIIVLTCISIFLGWQAVKGGKESTDSLLRGLENHASRMESVLREITENRKSNISKELIDKTIEQQGLILKELQNIRSSMEERNKKAATSPATTPRRKKPE
jgi:hypothetical protein